MVITSNRWVWLVAACGASVGRADPKPSPPTPALDVRWSADGGIAIGTPRAQLGSTQPAALAATSAWMFGTHDGWVTGWDTATGAVKVELGPPPDDDVPASSLAISGDGRTLAIGGAASVRIVRAPFDRVEQTIPKCATAHALSHDGRLLACSLTSPVVWDLATRKQVARAAGPKQGTRAATFSPDDRALVYATDTELVRWPLDGAPTVVFRAATRFQDVTFADGAALAYVNWLDKTTFTSSSKLVTMATGAATDVAVPDPGTGAVSPSGARVAIARAGEVRVLDAATGALVWSTTTTAPAMPVAFAGEDAIAFVEGTHVRFADLKDPPRAYPSPARFVGWLGDDAVAIARAGSVARLSLIDRAETPMAARVPTAAPTPGPRLAIADTAARVVEGTRELGRFPVEPPRGGRKAFAATIAFGAVSGSSVILLSHAPRSDGAADPQCVAIGLETCVHDWTISH